MPVPTKAEQEAEAANRDAVGKGQNITRDPGENAAVDTIEAAGETGEGEAGRQQAQPTGAEGEAAPKAPPVRSPFNDKRSEIAARFRTDRTQEKADQADEIAEFARSGMPQEFSETGPEGDLGTAPAGEVQGQGEAEGQGEQPAKPQTVKVKVRGEEKELTLDEVIAQAQIALASDSYLDEAKARLKSAEALENEVRAKAKGTEGQHPGTQSPAQTAEPAPKQGDQPQHPGEDITKLIETLQFGDPAEAATLLENTIQKRAQANVLPAVDNALRNQRLKDEGARTSKVLSDFERDNPELAKDKMARAAIEATVYDLQVEDLQTLGVDPSNLQTPGGRPVTPADIAQAHRFYRSEGFKVRSPDELLKKAKDNFIEWKGVGKTETTSDPAQGKPRVEVSVDRQARRQAIPQQPSRGVAPRPNAQTQPAKPRDRSDIVRDMMAKRNAPRNRNVG